MKALIAAAVLAAVTALPARVSANPFAADHVAVKFGDLDLTRARDQRRLETRLSQAAAAVCGRGMDRIHNVAKDKALRCQREVIAENRAKVETAAARSHTRQAVALR